QHEVILDEQIELGPGIELYLEEPGGPDIAADEQRCAALDAQRDAPESANLVHVVTPARQCDLDVDSRNDIQRVRVESDRRIVVVASGVLHDRADVEDLVRAARAGRRYRHGLGMPASSQIDDGDPHEANA